MIALSIDLSEFDIKFEPIGLIKSYALAYGRAPEKVQWTLYVDGSITRQGNEVCIIVERPLRLYICGTGPHV